MDIDARHPILGGISQEKTTDISEKFKKLKVKLEGEGHFFQGEPEDGYLDSSQCCRIIAEKLGLQKPSGYFSYEEYKERIEGSEWDADSYSRLSQLFMELCLEEKLDVYFT